MPVQITIDGEVLNSDDLTVDECLAIEAEYGINWNELLVGPAQSAKHAKAFFVAAATRRLGREKALELVGGMSMKQIADCIEIVDDDRPVQHSNGIPVVDPKATSDA